MTNFDHNDIADWTHRSVAQTSPDDLAFLALTGKAELQIRDFLALWCQRNLPEVTVAREWRRHDLALLGETDPVAVIEGKLWASFNVLNDKKLSSTHPTHGIRGAMEKDIVKLQDQAKKSSASGFISTLLMGIDIRPVVARDRRAVKYLGDWVKSAKRSESHDELHQTANDRLVLFSSSYGPTATSHLFSGEAYGAKVTMSVVVTQVV